MASFNRIFHLNSLYKNINASPQLLICDRLSMGSYRQLNTSVRKLAESPNEGYVISPVYHNRNPRNLEKLALAHKRTGWTFQSPRKDFYNKLVLVSSQRHTEGYVEHCSGVKVITASTKEWAIRNQVYSCTDVFATATIGRVLAQRCLESGISCVFVDKSEFRGTSDKEKTFFQAFEEANVRLHEPEVVQAEEMPGINYDGFHRYAEPPVWKEDYQDI